jgi:hypothetical protein
MSKNKLGGLHRFSAERRFESKRPQNRICLRKMEEGNLNEIDRITLLLLATTANTNISLLCLCTDYISFDVGLDRLCGLVVRVLGYRSGGPGSIPGTTRKK